MSPSLVMTDATVRLGGRLVLDRLSLTMAPGEVVGVVGPNGAGKTTLLRAAIGLQALWSGSSRLGDEAPGRLPPAELARRAAYLPQDRRLAWNLTAERAASLGAIDEPPDRARRIAHEALAKVGLAHLAGRGVFNMSGGERARVLLARLFATRAPLLLADEPTAGLDPDAQLLVLDLLRAEAGKGGAVLLTLHDLGLAARACDRLLVLRNGVAVAEGPPRLALSPAILADAFGLDGELIETAAGPILAVRRLSGAAL